MPESLQPLIIHSRQHPSFDAKAIALLSQLKTASYPDHKDRNPPRVKGTCKWFVGHKLFCDWQDGSQRKSAL
jgi:hypothetical protein